MSPEIIDWGVIGTSRVAEQFCRQLVKVPGVRLRHVVGQSAEKTATFARQAGADRHSTKLDNLLEDAGVRIVYIASPTRLHAEHATACLESGKAVLCEKPFTTDPLQFEKLAGLARDQGLFCMEAMWMRFNPLIREARDLVQSGRLGMIHHVRAEVGYRVSPERMEDSSRGPVWDFSVYALSLFQLLLGNPDSVQGVAVQSPVRGATFSALCRWGQATGTLTASIEAELPNSAEIVATEGRLTLGPPFFCPSWMRASQPLFPGSRIGGRVAGFLDALQGSARRPSRFQRIADDQSGFFLEAQEATLAVREGRLESPIVPHCDSLAVIRMARELQNAFLA